MSDPSAVESPPTCYRHPDRATYISCQRCGRPICPECSTQAAVGVQCPECVRDGRAASGGGLARALRPRRSGFVTYTLMGLIVIAYIGQIASGGALTGAWLLDPSAIAAEPWRLVTSAFLHSPSTFIHILFNLYALYAFGPALESFLGRVRYLALYFIAALGGSLGVVSLYALAIATDGATVDLAGGLLAPGLAVGASGAIFGLMGAYLPLRRAIGVSSMQLLIVIGINVVLGFVVPNIAWEGHLGGLVAGALVGWVYLRTRRPAQRRMQVLGVAGVAVGLLLILVLFIASAPLYYGL